jgi:hypothetical protein
MRYPIIAFLLFCSFNLLGQSQTTEDLHKKHSGARAYFFYHNTLRMINQSEDKDFDALIKDIKKMKFLMIDQTTFNTAAYKSLIGSYKKESFEEIMTSRFEGKNIDVLLKEIQGKTEGMILTVSDGKSLFVLDIVGSIALDKVTSFLTTFQKSSDVDEKIKQFLNPDK